MSIRNLGDEWRALARIGLVALVPMVGAPNSAVIGRLPCLKHDEQVGVACGSGI